MRLLKRLSARLASGVNDSGDVVGLLGTGRGRTPLSDKGFLFRDNTLIDIGTMDGDGGSVVVPQGVNSHGQIAGSAYSPTTSESRAFVWEKGAFQNLGTLRGGYSYGMGTNNHGDVIGFSDSSVFVYRDGAMIDLNQVLERNGSTWPTIQDVHAINDRGQIVGNAYVEDGDGVVHLRAVCSRRSCRFNSAPLRRGGSLNAPPHDRGFRAASACAARNSRWAFSRVHYHCCVVFAGHLTIAGLT